jgi:hypothetical protein
MPDFCQFAYIVYAVKMSSPIRRKSELSNAILCIYLLSNQSNTAFCCHFYYSKLGISFQIC